MNIALSYCYVQINAVLRMGTGTEILIILTFSLALSRACRPCQKECGLWVGHCGKIKLCKTLSWALWC